MTVTDLDPRTVLEAGLRTHFGRPVRIADIAARPLPMRSTHPIERLAVILDSGERLPVIFKRLEWGPENKHPWREPLVYRRLLAGGRFGAPVLYGSVYDHERHRYWLFLEDVGRQSLDGGRPEDWLAGVRCLAAMHGAYWGRTAELRAAKCLHEHDDRYFVTQALAARRAFKRIGDSAALARFDRWMDRFPALAAALARQPRTLVHGDIFAHNLMLQPGPVVRPIDWESAAVGTAAWDLTRLLDGWGTDQPEFLAAYIAECVRHSETPIDENGFRRAVRLCEVLLVLLHIRLCEDARPPAGVVAGWMTGLDAAWQALEEGDLND